jgi:hypothetical protein
MKWTIAIIVLTIAFMSCERNQAPKPSPTAGICNDTLSNDTIHFTAEIVPILNTYCNNPEFGDCHQPGSSQGDFTTYRGLQEYAENGELYNHVIIQKDMPPPASLGPTSLTPCDIIFIKNWISQGSLNN